VLSTVEEMTSADIATVLGIPEGSVRTRLMRARLMLKQKLAAKLERK
jgi:RNA polymerase sigma-70 factor (ECF subfamily)